MNTVLSPQTSLHAAVEQKQMYCIFFFTSICNVSPPLLLQRNKNDNGRGADNISGAVSPRADSIFNADLAVYTVV